MINTIAHIIIVAIPQVALAIIFCLLLINKFDLVNIDEITGKVKFSNKALFRLAIPTVYLSSFSILLRQLRFDLWVIPLFLLVSTYILILLAYRINKLKEAIKLFLSVFLMSIIIGIVEVIASPIIYIKGVTVYDVFDSFYINFIHSVPNAIVFFVIDFALYVKRKNLLNISVTRSILRSKGLFAVTILLMLLNFTLIFMYSLILNDKLLTVYSTKAQMVIYSILIMYPAINLGGLWILLYGVKFKEAMDKRIERDKLIKEMAVAKERNRVAMDLHDTLGHSLTLTIKLLEVCKVTSKTDISAIDKKLEEAIKIAQEGVNGVKHSVSGILGEKILNKDLISSLTELATEFEKNSGISVDVSIQGAVEAIKKKYTVVLYSICQEAMTNSLRHGKAKNIAIIIRFDSRVIKLSIFDDGVGCGKITKGFGLKGMEQRIKELNGKMSYNSDKGQGFILNFEVPRESAA